MRALLCVFFLFNALSHAQPSTAIKLDQAGYLPDAPKLAMVVSENQPRIFYLRRDSDSEPIYANWLTEPQSDANSGDNVQIADFTEFREPGRYYIDIPEIGRGYSFDIGPEIYRRPYYLAMRSFYGQRCGKCPSPHCRSSFSRGSLTPGETQGDSHAGCPASN